MFDNRRVGLAPRAALADTMLANLPFALAKDLQTRSSPLWGLVLFSLSFLPFAHRLRGGGAVTMLGRVGLGLTIPALAVASLRGQSGSP